LLNLIGHDPCAIDALTARADMTVDDIAGALLELELSGLIEKLPGNRIQRVR
jgi:DNA processing protein